MCNLPDETPGIIFARLDNLGARFDQLEKLPLSFARQANKGAAGVQYLSLDHAAKMIGKTKPTLQRALRREAALPRGMKIRRIRESVHRLNFITWIESKQIMGADEIIRCAIGGKR